MTRTFSKKTPARKQVKAAMQRPGGSSWKPKPKKIS